MNDINEMPPKCQYCPYWEVCEYPWVCPDMWQQDEEPIQQTCYATDTISRQAAIDAVKKNTFRLTFAEEQNCEGHLAWSANAVYSDVIEGALLELPSAQPERKWIPCSNPPKHHKDVIVRGIEAIGNVTVHKVMQWDVDTWRPTDYAPSVMWKEWSEI